MKISTNLCFRLFLSFFVLFVTETFAKAGQSPNEATGSDLVQKQQNSQSTTRESEKDSVETKPAPLQIINFVQRLDHYDSSDIGYFRQRYFVYKSPDYVEGNPVFLLVGGAGELEPTYVNQGIWNDFANESGALLLALEHRMYGESFPITKKYSAETLELMNSEQALADLIYFMDELILENPEGIDIPNNAKWIALGSFYGGTLAALLKMKFGHKITASVAFDAPLLPTVGFDEFFNVVERKCTMANVDNTIKEAFDELKRDFNQCAENNFTCIANKITSRGETFNFCNDGLSTNYDIKDHKTFFFWSLATIIARTFQFGKEMGIKDVIKILLNKQKIPNALNRLGEAVRLVLSSHEINCLIVNYEVLINMYKNTSTDAMYNYILFIGLGNRQNVYHHCSQWGQFETAYKTDGIFAELIPIDFYMNLCKNVFGPKFNEEHLERIKQRTIMMYGGREIDVNDVLFLMRDNDYFWTQLGYMGEKPWDNVTAPNSNKVLLKAAEQVKGGEKWNYIIGKLKYWSRADIKKKNSKGSVQKTTVASVDETYNEFDSVGD